jgi:magnesium-transporting ATPase (P-type)
MEILKLTQNFFVQSDKYMVHDKKTAICKTADLIEELGQVEFIFSDKTGTLTMNEMVFKFCAINNNVYGKKQEVNEKSTSFISEKASIGRDFGICGDTEASLKIKMKDSESKNIQEFFRALAVCHSCVAEKNKEGNLDYASASPDELALVKGASEMGFVFVNKTSKSIIIENRYLNENDCEYTEEWELLAEIPFDSDRKRMSVVVKNEALGKVLVYCKGADNIMLPRCKLTKEQIGFCESKKTII